MPRFDKWLNNIPDDAPLSRVARRAIGARLQAVVHYLEPAAQAKKVSAEDIHQLRIWTRRSAAALRLFAPLIPGKQYRKVRKMLRAARRGAGRVRDCDVFLDQFLGGDSSSTLLIKSLKKRRKQERRSLRKKCQKLLRHSRFERECERLLQSLEWPERHSSNKPPAFAPWCREQLAKPAHAFFDRSDAPLQDDKDWHALRIAGKRWRYALELAAAVGPARAHQRLYAALGDLQDRLGQVCDRLAAIEHLAAWQRQARGHKQRHAWRVAIQREQRKLAAARRQFLRWWTPTRRRRIKTLSEAVVTGRSRR